MTPLSSAVPVAATRRELRDTLAEAIAADGPACENSFPTPCRRPGIHQMAREELSLSKMTLSHQMIRLFFVEQVYRAMTILNGEPYHHE